MPTRPLISYYGGKQRIASRIADIVQSIPHTVYVEPFFGGGAVFYSRNFLRTNASQSYSEVINDSSELLVNLYRVAREQPEEFQRLIEFTPYSRSEYERSCEIISDPDAYSDIEKAWAYYLNVNQAFAHQVKGGWGTSVSSQNQAATWNARKATLPIALQRLRKVHIECDDALNIIKRWDSPQTLVYCDPPYPGTSQGHYDGYSIDDWRSLCELLDASQCSYVLSNYAQEIEPKSAQKRIEIEAICSASGKGKVASDRSKEVDVEELGDRSRTEVLWVCDRSSTIKSSLSRHVKDADLSRRYSQMSLLSS